MRLLLECLRLFVDGLSAVRSSIRARGFVTALAALAFLSPAMRAQTPTLLVDSDHRTATSLDGDWHRIIDPYSSGLYDSHGKLRTDGYFMNAKQSPDHLVEYDFSTSPTLKVPGDWNTQDPALLYYEGPVWYQRDFEYDLKTNHRVFLHIGAANYRSTVWVNTTKVCEHEGGFTPFDCEVTDALHPGRNFVVIAVDSTRLADGVPALQTDWWNYGGLTRDVSLIDVPKKFVDDFDLHLLPGARPYIEGYVHVAGSVQGERVTVSIPEVKLSETSTIAADGRASFELFAPGLELWAPGHPKLYQVEISAGDDSLEDEMGFRTVEVHGTDILLNGQPIFLRGVTIQGEAPIRTGRAYSEQDAATLLGWAREVGVNYVRLAHYPHDERMTRLADKMGILVWSEIPTYWAIEFDNPRVLAKAQQQLREMIRRDRDKASVILWSVANETPNTAARTKFLETLAAQAHALDPTRLVTAALLVRGSGLTKIVDDPLGRALDVIGANEYIGWYEHKPADADEIVWKIAYQKPLIMSEWGAGAKAGLHDESETRWSEEYQADVYRHQIAMLNRIPQLRGTSPWVLMDFRSPRRQLPEIQDGFNRKGIISDQGQKKAAFFVLQKAYRERTLGKAQ